MYYYNVVVNCIGNFLKFMIWMTIDNINIVGNGGDKVVLQTKVGVELLQVR